MPFTVSAYIPSIKPATYEAVCIDIEEKTARKDPTNKFLVWHFQLTDGSLRTVDASSSLNTSPKSKGGKWLAALMGREPAVGETVDPSGRACLIEVALDDNGYEKAINVMAPIARSSVDSTVPKAAVDGASAQHAAQEGDELPF